MMDALEFLPALLHGAVLTIVITFVSMAIALALGLATALGRIYGKAPLRWLLTFCVDFIRSTPLLLQLFYIYYVLPYAGIRMPALVAGVLGLSVNCAAYLSEVYRSSITSVATGQIEAARALGLKPQYIFRLVIFPQAIRTAIPPIGNHFIAMFKDTALVAIISVNELMFTADQLASITYQYMTIYTTVFIIYFAISYPASWLVVGIEAKLKKSPAH